MCPETFSSPFFEISIEVRKDTASFGDSWSNYTLWAPMRCQFTLVLVNQLGIDLPMLSEASFHYKADMNDKPYT